LVILALFPVHECTFEATCIYLKQVQKQTVAFSRIKSPLAPFAFSALTLLAERYKENPKN